MLATIPNSTAFITPLAQHAEDTRSAKRKRYPATVNELMKGKRLKVVYTATVPMKRWKLPMRVSGNSGLLMVKTMPLTSNRPLLRVACDGLPGNSKKDYVVSNQPTLELSSSEETLNTEKTSETSGPNDAETVSRISGYPAGEVESVLEIRNEPSTLNNAEFKDTSRSKVMESDKGNDSLNSKISQERRPKDILEKVLLMNGISSDSLTFAKNGTSEVTKSQMTSFANHSERSLPKDCPEQQLSLDTMHCSLLLNKSKQIQRRTEEAVNHNGTGSDVRALGESNGARQRTANDFGSHSCTDKKLAAEQTDAVEDENTYADLHDDLPSENSSFAGNKESVDCNAGKNITACVAPPHCMKSLKKNEDAIPSVPETDSSTKQADVTCKREQSGVTVKTISTGDLMKLLDRFNLTLKSVPIDENLASTVSSGSTKFRTLSVNSKDNVRLKVGPAAVEDSDKTRNKAVIALDSNTAAALKLVQQSGKVSLTTNTKYTGFRKTSSGIFSDWKIKKTRLEPSGKGLSVERHCHTSSTDSACRKSAEIVKKRECWHVRKFNGQQHERHVNNGSEVHDSCFESSLHMIPLATAFHDLEARDKAALETIEITMKSKTELSLKATTEGDCCQLSPVKEDGVRMLHSPSARMGTDPILTSVAFENSETACDELVGDLVQFQNQMSSSWLLPGCDESPTKLKSKDSWEETAEGNKSKDEEEPILSEQQETERNENTQAEIPLGCESSSTKLRQFILHSPTQEIQHDMRGATESNSSSIVVSSRGKILSTTSDFNTRERIHCSSASSDCSIDERVTEDDSPAESTQMATWDTKVNLDQIQLDKVQQKPVEEWTSEEVSDWLSKTIHQHERVKTSSLSNLGLDSSSTEYSVDGPQNFYKPIFSRITDGPTLRSLTLDNLHQHCADQSLAQYLHQKVQELDSGPDTTDETMHRGGYCAVTGPPAIAVTSVEQLEESVNFDDLLGFDNILGSLELTEVLDSEAGSYLKSLGTDGEIRFPDQLSFGKDRTLPGFYNHFSPASKMPYYESANSDQRLNTQESDPHFRSPTLAHGYFSYFNLPSEEHAMGKSVSYYGHSNGQDASGIECTYYSESVPSTPTTPGPLPRPLSPSTFYNLPTVSQTNMLQENRKRRKTVHGTYMTCAPASSCSRNGTESDSDSGIHSPDSTPNKHSTGGLDLATSGRNFKVNILPLPNYCENSPTYECGSAAPFTSSSGAWNNRSEQGVLMEVFSMPITGVDARRRSSFPTESHEEIWECASTSSTASTLSIECEKKLLNIDDCKTYVTHGAAMSHQPDDNHLRENGTDHEIHSLNDEAVFTQLADISYTHSSTPSTASKRLQVVNHGAITTVYPAFVTQVCRSDSLHAGDDVTRTDATVDPFQRQYSESTENSEKLLVAKTSKRLPKNRSKRSENNGAACSLADRRPAFDGSKSIYTAPYELKNRRATGKSVHLWEFIRDTLLDPQYCPRLIKWEDRKTGIFRFVQSDVVAGMWGEKKNNPKMTYEKLSRAMRYYYNRGILERVDGRRLVYKFGRNAHGWQQFECTNDAHHARPEIWKVKKEVTNDSLFPQPSPKSTPKRKSGPCRIAISLTDDSVPFATKRRRQLGENVPRYVSVVTNQNKPNDEQAPRDLNEKIAAVQKTIALSNVKLEQQESPSQPTVSSNTPATSTETSCIVYVARPERLTNQIAPESELNVFEAEALSWSPETSPDRQVKLPSADVLLGKQFKIATAAI